MLGLLFLGLFVSPIFGNVQYVFLNVLEPASSAGEYLGVPAGFGGDFLEEEVSGELVVAEPLEACTPLTGNYSGRVVLAVRGNCSFAEKCTNAQDAGATYVVIANDQDGDVAITMGGEDNDTAVVVIPAFMISEHDGLTIINNDTPVSVTILGYNRPSFDLSVLILMCIAVATVAAAAWWSASRERAEIAAKALGLPPPPMDDEFVPPTYLNEKMAAGFIVVASASLLLLFFFISDLIYLLIVIFALGGCEGTTICFSALAHHFLPVHLARPVQLPCLGTVSCISIVVFIPRAATSITWAIMRHESWAWVLQNIMSVCLLMMIQKVVRLPNIKVSSILLVTAFFYDIFWVFISPALFSSSVMVTVATGGDTGESVPMLIAMPRFNDLTGGYSLLGLGDIALPGLFISYLLRFDYAKGLSGFRGYFIIGVIGYAVGMLFTDLALIFMKQGQPALLYLVPMTLGVTLCLAFARGHAKDMWKGQDEANNLNGGLLDDEVNAAFTAVPSHDIDSNPTATDPEDSVHSLN